MISKATSDFSNQNVNSRDRGFGEKTVVMMNHNHWHVF